MSILENPGDLAEMKYEPNLEKYLKNFALRFIQSILQRKTGNKRQSSLDLDTSFNCFDVVFEDMDLLKKGDSFLQNCDFLSDCCFCIEMQLYIEGEMIILETWSLNMKEKHDPSITLTSVYSSMISLLLSVVATSQSTPALKFVEFLELEYENLFPFFYRLYFGCPQPHILGSDYGQNCLGEVVTPVGIMTVTRSFPITMIDVITKVQKLTTNNRLEPDEILKTIQPIDQFPLSRLKGPASLAGSDLCDDNDDDVIRDKSMVSSSSSQGESLVNSVCAATTKYIRVALSKLVLFDNPLMNPSSEMKQIQLPDSPTKDNKSANTGNGNVGSDGDVNFDCNTNKRAEKMTCIVSCEYDDWVTVEMGAVKSNTSDLDMLSKDISKPASDFQLTGLLSPDLSFCGSEIKRMDAQRPAAVADDENINMGNENLKKSIDLDNENNNEQSENKTCTGNSEPNVLGAVKSNTSDLDMLSKDISKPASDFQLTGLLSPDLSFCGSEIKRMDAQRPAAVADDENINMGNENLKKSIDLDNENNNEQSENKTCTGNSEPNVLGAVKSNTSDLDMLSKDISKPASDFQLTGLLSPDLSFCGSEIKRMDAQRPAAVADDENINMGNENLKKSIDLDNENNNEQSENKTCTGNSEPNVLIKDNVLVHIFKK